MKKTEPNCAAPIGLPHGRMPSSRISFDHSNACIATKVSPNAAVTSISAAALTRSRRYAQLTAIAIVPLLLIRMKVMIAIRISGTSAPPTLSEKTWLALGHGTVVALRTVM